MCKDKIYLGNNLDVLKTFEDNSIDSVVTDPPYGINFMNKKWDYDVPSVELWLEVIRVLKPGGHILCACGTRTQHRMAVNIEDAGFEIRDIVAWVYGSGFPKSLDIGKAVSKVMGEEVKQGTAFKTAGEYGNRNLKDPTPINDREQYRHNPKTEEGKIWQGWGTALKPAMELWTLARKPFKSTVAENVLKYGTGGINIDGCRVEFNGDENTLRPLGKSAYQKGSGMVNGGVAGTHKVESEIGGNSDKGRFPANLIHDGSAEVVDGFKEDAQRFFYTAKASQAERNMGLYGFEEDTTDDGRDKSIDNAFQRGETKRRNIHPTVKPLELMRYLVRLITPKDGLCLDPYVGSGTTAIAAKQEKMRYIGIELDEKYHAIAEARIKAAFVQYDIFDYL